MHMSIHALKEERKCFILRVFSALSHSLENTKKCSVGTGLNLEKIGHSTEKCPLSREDRLGAETAQNSLCVFLQVTKTSAPLFLMFFSYKYTK